MAWAGLLDPPATDAFCGGCPLAIPTIKSCNSVTVALFMFFPPDSRGPGETQADRRTEGLAVNQQPLKEWRLANRDRLTTRPYWKL